MTTLGKIKYHLDVVEYFKELSFYEKHIKKTKTKSKHLKTLICFLNFFL